MRQTSLQAYDHIIDTGKLGRMQQEVFNTLKQFGNMTNTELSGLAGLPINCVTPRMNELVKDGFVEGKQKRRCKITGRKAIEWGLK